MVKASNMARFDTAWMTAVLEVNRSANSLCRVMMRIQKKSPIAADVATETMLANFAPLALPAPSSLLTLTLRQSLTHIMSKQKVSKSMEIGSGMCYSINNSDDRSS
uniref:Uncharacterized protein n=1 Tax=Nymphaea colorata TaxID=210225 RepID=A0A5K1FQM8_9MAGN